ncbi:MAG: threonine/serine exporter family protein, partial [Oscillospiraceae bacterium]|nr:threonine/serine exporter family protein [Oscillospiraceae bacterium]
CGIDKLLTGVMMDILKDIVRPCAIIFVACIAFGMQFNIVRRHLLAAAVSAVVSELVYSLLTGFGLSTIKSIFFAAAAVALYSEILAKALRSPVNMYLVVGIIPLVPGSTIYQTMLQLVVGNNDSFLGLLLVTFESAGAIAMGIFMISSAVRLLKDFKAENGPKILNAVRDLASNHDKNIKKI